MARLTRPRIGVNADFVPAGKQTVASMRLHPGYCDNIYGAGALPIILPPMGKEAEVEQFLKSALPLANEEQGTIVWFALKLGASTFGIFDAFADEAGREAHLSGPIAAALMSKWKDLLAEPPKIEKIKVLAAKLA